MVNPEADQPNTPADPTPSRPPLPGYIGQRKATLQAQPLPTLAYGGGTGRARLGFKPAAWPWRAAAARAVTTGTGGAGDGGGQHEGGSADRH
uniref:Uncharacterized protein n=1 Tax=Oryza sativa subsp. japonica TaxID=39947 RepID=Q69LL6_ORYSJ|nr:hypothetical protein [Oryza sativa Japonica Group]BAD31759.1 hypothetical protein [Oryza sativa Japonica Group]